MSYQSTNLVRGLRGFSPIEKAVAFVLADHDDHKGGGTYPSMSTVALEAGLQDRETASRVTRRLVERGVILTGNPSKGGKPTVYRFNFELANRDSRIMGEDPPTVTPESRLPNRDSSLANCDSRITVEDSNRDSRVTVEEIRTVTPESRFASSNRDSTPPPTVTLEPSNRDSPVTGRVEEVREEERLKPSRPPSADEASSSSNRTINRQKAKRKTRPKPAVSVPAMEVANLLRQRILGNNAKANITHDDVESWGRTADLMMRLDHRTPAEITTVLEWSQSDEFWQDNILSMKKLRKQFDQLWMKKKKGTTNGNRRPSGAVKSDRGSYNRPPDHVVL